MSALDVTTSFARTFVDECVRNGITNAVVSPGSRNTPLTLALVRDGRLRVDVVLDERSAGFRALGIGLASGSPAIVCCTSGTAAVNLHPAVVEAHHARVPLLVCTADRPAELRDVGAGQTIDQARLFGDAVRWYHDPGPPEVGGDDEVEARWRALVCRAAAEACGPPAGPVHLNLPFREPLVPTGAPLVDAPGRAGGLPWVRTSVANRNPTAGDVARIADLVRATPRGLVVAGSGAGVESGIVERFARAARWPVVADALSQLRTGEQVVSTYESLVRAPGFQAASTPDIVLRLGAPLTSKVTNAWLDRVPTVLVDPDDSWLDPRRASSERLRCDPGPLLEALTSALEAGAGDAQAGAFEDRWLADWLGSEAAARRAIDAILDHDVACEARIARDIAAAIPAGGTLVVASSLPVRALEWSMAARPGLRVLANRGANGIDGFVSTAIGIAGAGAPVVALCGDLCFLHDTNGLLGASLPPVTFVVVDNNGGGIFGYLAQRDLPEFESLFATPQGVDVVAVARAHGVAAERVPLDRVAAAVAAGADHVRVLVVDVDRETARGHHGAVWQAVAAALGQPGS